jgi:glutamate synthase domain-containing protein 3
MDIPIYKAAKKHGLDTVILQHELGEYRAVTEIVDTRKDSQNHVYKLPPELHTQIQYPYEDLKNNWTVEDWEDYESELKKLSDAEYKKFMELEYPQRKEDKYATIWFVEDGFLKLHNGEFIWSAS